MRDVTTGAFDRAQALERLAGEEFDVLVIGAGITGAGVALDAARRGLRTAIVDKGDFASGTSSKSSKLVHGGLRYLQQRELGLVYESLAERQLLLKNAPHLVSPLPFLIPLFGRDGVVSKTVTRSFATALWLYDVAGGWRIGARHRRVPRAEALEHLPALRADDLVAGFVYFDAHADDARLTLAIARTAALDYGAVAANYATVTGFVTETDGTVRGVRLSPARMPHTAGEFGEATEGPDFDVRARVVVNATGVWADEVRALADTSHGGTLRPAKGVHLTVPASRLPCDIAAVLPVRGDRRSVFVVPWDDCEMTYVGTTDTDYDGPLDAPACTAEDVDYLLAAVNASTDAALRREDVTGVWAGLRPLLAPRHGRKLSARTADLSRRHSVHTSRDGLITVTGGKLTTYRRMAEDTMRQVEDALETGGRTSPASGGRRRRAASTARVAVRGATPRPSTDGPRRGLRRGLGRGGARGDKGGRPSGDHLEHRYGAEAAAVRALTTDRPELLAPIVEGLPYLGAEVVYAVRHEMALTLDDVLGRRTRAVLQHARASAAAAPAVAELMAGELGWSAEQAQRHAEAFITSVRAELAAAGLPLGEEVLG